MYRMVFFFIVLLNISTPTFPLTLYSFFFFFLTIDFYTLNNKQLFHSTCLSIFIIFSLSSLRVCLVGGVEKWEDRKLWENGKHLVFSHVCLVGGMEKWEGGKLFCLLEKKSERIENVVYINWLLYSCYIIDKK